VVNIAIFASGTGSNARKIQNYFETSAEARVVLLVSNRKDAPVLQWAADKDIPTALIDRKSFYEPEGILGILQAHSVDLIALAGFLWLIPPYLIKAYPRRILNIHPALLPKFGGKGMYGMNVHQAVLAAGEKESGISIHLVDEQYDHGDTLFQARCPVEDTDTPDTLAHRVLQLEHSFYPQIIAQYIREGLPTPFFKTQMP
jgi:phosphoribosylglycinamide formyltransferase 1